MTDRRRNTLILLLVAGLIAASVAVIAAKKTRLGLDLKGGVQLVYQAKPTAQSKVDADSLNRAIDIMRKRVDQIGVAQPEIQRSGADEINVALPDVKDAGKAEKEVGKTAQLFFYDWEPNVIGPEGKPAPSEQTVTGGANAGSSNFGLPEYQAVLRAEKRSAVLRKTDTTWSKGCTPAQAGGCIYGSWYLIEAKHEKVLRGPEETEKNLYSEYEVPAGAKVKAVRVNPGTVLVRSRPVEGKSGKVTNKSPNSWYVLNDDPVLTGADVKNPTQSFDEGGGGTGAPNVTFGFTGHGKSVFQNVTKEIAHRGQEAQLPGVGKEAAQQHFAVVLDDQLITTPSIDYTKYPEGIDANTGSQISGGFTIDSAQELAQELQSGALPIKLVPISNSQVSATLGKTALNQGLVAGLVGFGIVCLFLLLFYRVLGAIAVGGLVIYGIYFFALIKLIPITLTLPGIAGLILTIGVAADANIVIFERVKEEIRGGRSVIAGIATGYRRGFAAIVDANVVTFMTAFILFALATAEVKGFAFTLGIGTITSLFTAVLATQAALGAMGRSKLVTHPSALGAGRRGKGWTFALVLLPLGRDPAHRRPGHRRQRSELRHRLQVGHAYPDGLHPAGLDQAGLLGDGLGRLLQRRGAEVHQQGDRRRRISDLHQDAGTAGAAKGACGAGNPAQDEELLLDLDRSDVRQDGRQQRDHRDHRLAAGDLCLYRAALRVEVRRAGLDRVDARSPDHRWCLLSDGPRSHDLDRRRAADDPRIFALRHDHRVRSCARERAAHATRGLLADRQPLDVRGAHPFSGDELLHVAARARAVSVRR